LPAAEPVRVIYDTDMGNDIDDALALAVLHALENRGEARILAVTLTKDSRYAGPYVDLVNTFYGRGGIPVGVVANGKTPKDSNMLRVPLERNLYPHKLRDSSEAPDAVELLRTTLAAERDASVVVVQVGFSTNLARLLVSPGGAELARRKVRLLSVMAGAFPAGQPEYNVKTDLESARRVFSEWPSAVVASGFEVGLSILFPAVSIENDFGYLPHHPVADAYRAYKKMPYDRPTWDLTAALYAVRPERGYFTLSEPGWIRVEEDGRTRWERDAAGRHRYLKVEEKQRIRALETLVALASEPPRR
jgi:inosine-uridine nucleoside N-ribohydrolase